MSGRDGSDDGAAVQDLWSSAANGDGTRRLVPDVRRWCRGPDTAPVTFRLSRVLTGHGRFRRYLTREEEVARRVMRVLRDAGGHCGPHDFRACSPGRAQDVDPAHRLWRNTARRPSQFVEMVHGHNGRERRGPREALSRATRVAS